MPELLEKWSTHSLPSLPGPLWPGVVAPDRVQSMAQIEINRVLEFFTTEFIDLMSRVFTNGPGDWGSIQGQVIPKT